MKNLTQQQPETKKTYFGCTLMTK